MTPFAFVARWRCRIGTELTDFGAGVRAIVAELVLRVPMVVMFGKHGGRQEAVTDVRGLGGRPLHRGRE